MSIQSEINRITGKRDQSFTELSNKGVSIQSGSTIDDLPGYIAALPETIKGSGAPTTSTAGLVGQHYFNTSATESPYEYVCTDATGGVYTWEPFAEKGETGDSGVYYGTTTPTDPDVTVWIDPSGTGISIPTKTSDLNNDVPFETMGMGTQIPAGSDLNDYSSPGVYYSGGGATSATLSNTPYTAGAFRLEVTHANSTSRPIQTLFANLEGRIFHRGYNSNSTTGWTEWKELAWRALIPTAVSDLTNDVPYLSMRLGERIPVNSNLNNYTTPGVYFVASGADSATITNGPRTDVAYRLEVTYINGTSRIRQAVYTLGSASLSYTRCYSSTGPNNGWEVWAALTLRKAEVLVLGAQDSGINRWARVIYDPNSSTVRIHLSARNTSANMPTSANLGTVPAGYRPSEDTQLQAFLVLADGSAHAYSGVVKADGTIHQSFGTAVREVLLVGEYTL